MVRRANEAWRATRSYLRLRRMLAKCEAWADRQRAKMGPIELAWYDAAHERAAQALIYGSGPLPTKREFYGVGMLHRMFKDKPS